MRATKILFMSIFLLTGGALPAPAVVASVAAVASLKATDYSVRAH